jgi:hypothetical protein
MNALLKKYRKLENGNFHNEAAMLLVKNFGTKEELKRLKEIKKNHIERGHILYEEQRERFEISQKYYAALCNLK